MIFRIAGALLIATIAAPSWAQIYKWVDEKGVTHYSESPPPDKKATKIEAAPPSAPGAGAPDWKAKERDARRRTLERSQAEQAAERKQASEDAARSNRCLRAQRDLKVFEAQRPVYRVNERGDKVYLEDSARPAALESARRDVQAFCPK